MFGAFWGSVRGGALRIGWGARSTWEHTNTQTHKNTNIQTYRHTNIQSYKDTKVHTYIHTYILKIRPSHYIHIYFDSKYHSNRDAVLQAKLESNETCI